MPVEQLSLLSLPNLANTAPTVENCRMPPNLYAQAITFIAKCSVIESLSCSWQDRQRLLVLNSECMLSSRYSCPCQIREIQNQLWKIVRCPHLDAQAITFIANCSVIELLSCIWQDGQRIIVPNSECPLSSCHSCPCQILHIQHQLWKIVRCRPICTPKQ